MDEEALMKIIDEEFKRQWEEDQGPDGDMQFETWSPLGWTHPDCASLYGNINLRKLAKAILTHQ